MPPKGYKSLSLPESLITDLRLLMVETKSKSMAEVIEKLFRFYRFGEKKW